jgi:hypothetical protein
LRTWPGLPHWVSPRDFLCHQSTQTFENVEKPPTSLVGGERPGDLVLGVVDDVASSGDAASSRCWLMTWPAQWLVVGGRMVAFEVVVGTHCSKAVVVVVRTRQSDVVEFPTISSHE